MATTITTTIVSTVEDDGTMNVNHLIEIDSADDAPESFVKAIARSAGKKLIDSCS